MRIAIWIALGISLLTVQAGYALPEEAKKPAKSTGGNAVASLTGCLDEKDGRYVLLDDHNLNPVFYLVASGFSAEGFAKHLGHKVIVRGNSAPTETGPVFRVTRVATVSEMCVPEQ